MFVPQAESSFLVRTLQYTEEDLRNGKLHRSSVTVGCGWKAAADMVRIQTGQASFRYYRMGPNKEVSAVKKTFFNGEVDQADIRSFLIPGNEPLRLSPRLELVICYHSLFILDEYFR